MDADLYVEVLRQALLPFIRDKFPEGHKFMQDNDLKHMSLKAQQFMIDNCWKTPAESPDINPIENLWHELKEYHQTRGQTQDKRRAD